jgi:adenosylcobinamide-GDP ribazoletransferase
MPLSVASVLDLVVLAMLSGGLHLDGLADTADGLFFPGEREKRLAIMRDSRTGAFGVAAVALVLLLETAALASVSRPARVPVLVAAAALSRWSMGFALWSSPAARPDGLGASFKARLRLGDVLIASALAAAIAAAVLGLDAIVAFAVAWLVAMGVAAIARARIGGMTGDVCGGVGELAFAGQLVLASAIAR